MWPWKRKSAAPNQPAAKLSGRFSPVTEQVLVDAGWTPGRRCDTAPIETAFAKEGFSLHQRAREFLQEFHGLAVDVPINGFPSIHGFIHLDPVWALRFFGSTVQKLVQKPVCPIGTASGHSMVILMDTDGGTYLLDSDWSVFAPLSRTGVEALEVLCDGRNGRVDSVLLVDGKPSGIMLREGKEREHWDLSRFPDLQEFFPPASLEPARRPPTVHAMPSSVQALIAQQKIPRQKFHELVIASGGIMTGRDGQFYFCAHTENVLAIRKAAPFRPSGLPPGVPERSFWAGERIVFTPPRDWPR